MKAIKNVTGKLLFEITAVVIGISIAFFLDEWKEEQKNKREEILLLQSIYTDIARDSTQLKKYLSIIELYSKTYNRLLQEGWSPDSARSDIDQLITYMAYKPINLSYQELQQTGSSKLITNKQLLSQIINLNERSIRLIDESTSIDKNFVLNRMIPYMENHFDYPYDTSANKTIFQENEFRNLIITNIAFKGIDKMTLLAYQKQANQLLVDLDKEIKQLAR